MDWALARIVNCEERAAPPGYFGVGWDCGGPAALTCARRLAGRASRLPRPRQTHRAGLTPAPGTPAPASPSCFPSSLLPVLALVLGALGLLATGLAEALTIPSTVRSAFITGSGTPSAQQNSSTVWSATLTPVAVIGGIGCGSKSECDTQLTDNSFTVGGQSYHFLDISVRRSGPLLVTLSTAANLALREHKFCVGSAEFDFSIFGIAPHYWTNHGLTWTVGTPVSLSISTSCAPTRQTQSTDATLSGLTASSSTSASGLFYALNIGTVASGITSYTASVANSITHAKLTPTVNDPGATVKVGKGSSLTAVASGSASGAIALGVGSNAITVEVTAEDGTTKTYTVTVTRQQAQQTTPTVSLAAAPNPVIEGFSVTVTATLSSALSSAVTIPVTVSTSGLNTAESTDVGTLTSITIASGQTTGTGTLATNQDADEDDEIFTVSLGTLPSSVTAGSPSSLQVTINDDDTGGGSSTSQHTGSSNPGGDPPPGDDNDDGGGGGGSGGGGGLPPITIGLHLSATEVEVYETGDPGTVTVALNTAPPATVTVAVASADPTTVTAAPAQLVFTPGNWAEPQPVTLMALADADDVDRESVRVRLTPRGTGSRGVPGQVTVTHREVPPIEVLLRMALKRVQEGRTVPMTVSLSAAPRRTVTVPVVAMPGTATPADYAVGPLSITFGPDETTKTVRVTAVADDLADEPDETVRLAVGPDLPAQVTAGAGAATEVTIEDRTRAAAVGQAWLSRFGRTVGGHVTDAIGDRLRGAPGQDAHVTIGGYRLPLDRPATSEPTPPRAGTGDAGSGAASNETAAATTVLTEVARMLGMGPGAATAPATPWAAQRDPRRSPGQALPTFRLREVLQGSAFRLNLGATDADAATPRLTAWGRVAGTTFEGRDGTLALNGDVLTGTVGLDGTWDRLVLGLAVAHSRGNGGYGMQLNADPARGDLEQTLTSLHPYLRYAVTDRLDVWGLVGYGWGELDLEMANGVTVETDTRLVMGAFGGRGILLAPADTGGFQLATRTDAMLTRTSSDAVANSAATDADAHRLRVILEGSRGVTWADGRSLTPTVELGVRHDWGDAETGFGLEVGGRVSYADPTLGLTVEGTVRGLLAHEADAYKEWGASGTVRLDPGATGQGLSVTLAPTWGAAASGVEGLWSRQTTQGLAPATQSAQRGRLAADVGYGFAAFGSGLLTPYAGTVLSDGADRTYRVGTRVQLPGLTLNLEGTRQAPARQPVNQGVRLQVEWGF